LPRGHAAKAFVDVGVGFADRSAVVVAVGFLRIYGFYISASVYHLEDHGTGNTPNPSGT